jgi:cytidylate kinase
MTSLGLIVMEGRDIGTNVFPGAKFKFFLTADPIVRARRRLNQAGENYDGATLKTVAEQIAERDRLDSSRAVSPLKPATDAVAVDSSNMSIEEVISFMLKIIKGGQGNGN